MTKEKLDSYGHKLLLELDLNARLPFNELAKKIGLSPQLTKYRYNNLVNSGVIVGTVPIIDMHKLGFYTYRTYFRIKKDVPNAEQIVIDNLVKNEYTIWVVSGIGKWDIEYLFLANSPIAAGKVVDDINEKIGQYIKDYTISASIANIHFNRTYLVPGYVNKSIAMYGYEPEKYVTLDELELKIIKKLSESARVTSVELAHSLGVTPNTIKNRLSYLEEEGVIVGYRCRFDLDKIGRGFFKAMLYTTNLSEKEKRSFLTFCSKENSVAYLIFCFGSWETEIECEVKNEQEFIDILNRFLGQYNKYVKDYDIFHILKEHKMNYLPNVDLLIKTASEK